MSRKFAFVVILLAVISCGGREKLPRDAWNEDVYNALTSCVAEVPAGSYAVFDFDNTTIIGDISMYLMEYMIENMRFAFEPNEAFDAFTTYIPSLDLELEGVGRTSRSLALELSADYTALRSHMAKGDSVEYLKNTENWKRLKSNLFLLNEGIENTFDYATWCSWAPGLLRGLTYAELTSLTKESVGYWMGEEKLILPKETVDLFEFLRRKGVDIYLCSASLEVIVEAMACDPEFGIGLDPDHVFGVRLEKGEYVKGPLDSSYPQTFLDGKVRCINQFIRPEHAGKDPVLVAGDSVGDLPMLTAFPKSLSLVYDCARSGAIADYIKSGECVVQPRYEYTKL